MKPSLGICFLVIVTLSSRLHAQIPEGCELQLNRVVENSVTQPDSAKSALLQLADPIAQFTCFKEEASIRGFDIPIVRISRKDMLAAIQAQTNQGNQQQGASTGSSATTDTVSKPSGPSAFIQNFGGISESTSGSSATYQWNPGTLISKLATGEIVPLCNSSLLITDACLSTAATKILVPLTLSVTSNTSSSAQSLTATATSTSSTSSAQQVDVSSKGAFRPSFGGFSVKYVPWKFYTKGATLPKLDYSKVAESIFNIRPALTNCAAFTHWQQDIQHELSDAFDTFVQSHPERLSEEELVNAKTELRGKLKGIIAKKYSSGIDGLTSCYPGKQLQDIQKKFSTYLTAFDAIDAAIDLAKTSSPILGFEYDLSTPQNLTSYSTVKANFSTQFQLPWIKSADTLSASAQRINGAVNGTNSQCPSTTTKTADQKGEAGDTVGRGAASPSGQQIKNAGDVSTSGATACSKPFTVTAFFGGAFYNSSPSSSIPSASLLRDIQGGAEFSYLAPSSKLPGVGSLLGNTTLAAAYYYQDQTSPAILNGLPSTITFTGLPSNANTVFAKRGVINLAQVRLGFGSGKNITFPLSATYSNRTELIAHPTWGLQFGFNYNLSSLLTSTGGTK